NLSEVDLGFGRERLMSFQVDPSLNGYTAERIRGLAEALQQRLAAIPGVRAAAIGANPVVANNQDLRSIRFAARHNAADEDLTPAVDSVSPGYFTTMEIPLLGGRDFTARDRAGAPRVAIVNDVFARHYFPGGDAIGQRFGFGLEQARDVEIVGIVRS